MELIYRSMATPRRDFTPEEKEFAWQLAAIIPGLDPDRIRMDYAGAYIIKEYYGRRDSNFGWEIDHIKPLEKDGPYELWNYAPLQWENNVQKDINFPIWQTRVVFSNQSNIECLKDWFGVVGENRIGIIPIKRTK